jgi:hypothetical protein
MMADADTPEELSADEVLVELQGAGIALTSQNLQSMIAAHLAANERNEAADRETERRHRPHALLGLLPESMDEDTAYRAAIRKELIAWKIAGRWFSTLADVENWLVGTDKFKTAEAEKKWRAMTLRRFP